MKHDEASNANQEKPQGLGMHIGLRAWQLLKTEVGVCLDGSSIKLVKGRLQLYVGSFQEIPGSLKLLDSSCVRSNHLALVPFALQFMNNMASFRAGAPIITGC